MPIFTSRNQNRSGFRDDFSYEELHERSGHQHQHQHPVQVQSTRPVRICVSTPVARPAHISPTSATSLLGNHAILTAPIPSYETIQQGFAPVSDVAPESMLKPPSYNPRWEQLPPYPTTGRPSDGSGLNLGATPTSYWAGATTMVPIATGGGGMFFNSPFQHYQLIQQSDLEGGSQRNGNDRICGMSVGRADLVINMSLLALCILIWSAVVLSLNFTEPRNTGAGQQASGDSAYPNYGRPLMY